MPGQECPQSPGRVLGIGEGTLNNVQKLMVGTANLNQMRAEIKAVVSTVASKINVTFDTQDYDYKESGVYWVIARDRFTVISCHDTQTAHKDSDLFSSLGDREIGLQDVVRVHQSLEEFLTWALSLDPSLESHLKPIFEAAEL